MPTERAAFEIAQTLDIVPFPAARRRRTLAQQPIGDRDIIDGLPLGQIDAVDVKLVPRAWAFSLASRLLVSASWRCWFANLA